MGKLFFVKVFHLTQYLDLERFKFYICKFVLELTFMTHTNS